MTKDSKILLICSLLAIGGLLSMQAQSQRTKGVVLTEENKPVVGANVSVQGKTTGTITDIDGHFELNTHPDDVLIITIPGKKGKKLFSANRVSVWGDVGLTTTPDVWGKNANGEYSLVGGGVGVGYQRVSNRLLLTIGLEFRCLNYCRFFGQYRKNNQMYYPKGNVLVNSGYLQMPVMVGMEFPHFYWQVGGKLGTALYNNYDQQPCNDMRSEYKFLRVAPALEIGANFNRSTPLIKTKNNQEAVLHVNYKLAVCTEWGFEFVHGGTNDWTNAMVGLKFSVGFQKEIKKDDDK